MTQYKASSTAASLPSPVADKFVTVDGLRIRYIEDGDGPAVICLHGGALGSSCDVFLQNIRAFAKAGFRAIAYDQPGFGLSDPPKPDDLQNILARDFLQAMGIGKTALIGHSRAGGKAIELALKNPETYTHVVVLGTGSLLPPLGDSSGSREAKEQRQQESEQACTEPTLEDTRKLLEADLYNHDLITPGILELRHSFSLGRNFAAFVARNATGISNKKPKTSGAPPLRLRLAALKIPLMMIYGRADRANAAERAALLKQQQPELNIHIIEHCKHLVPLDAAEEVARLVLAFLQNNPEK
jgi:pimeloyl-ACP methyl ester carboxylesterase